MKSKNSSVPNKIKGKKPVAAPSLDKVRERLEQAKLDKDPFQIRIWTDVLNKKMGVKK